MRRAVAVLLGAAALAAGCTSAADDPAPVGVTTPPPSATVGPTGTGASTRPEPAPTPTATPARTPSGPQEAYASLAAGWQTARSRFFTAVSDGRRRPVAEQRALAAAYLSASRRFAAGLRVTAWPARARNAVRELLAANAAQQVPLKAMSTAASSGAFTGHLADYGVGAARENRAVAAVARALDG